MAKIGKPRSTKGLALFCAKLADEKLAKNLIAIDLKNIEVSPAEFFVICSCESEAQVVSIYNNINRKCKELDMERPKMEGNDSNQWVLLDFFDVVMHIMLEDIRSYYNIEKLWGDGKFYYLNEKSEFRVLEQEKVLEYIIGS